MGWSHGLESRRTRSLLTAGAFAVALLGCPASPPSRTASTSRQLEPPSRQFAQIVTRALPQPERIRLSRAQLRVGLSREDLSRLSALCAREALPEECLDWVSRGTQERALRVVSTFWLERTEVTTHAYAQCARLGPCPDLNLSWHATAVRDDYPATLVDREAARTFCKFRGGRLPTRAEFERAARGTASRLFPWGDLYNSRMSNHGRFGIDPTDSSDGYPGLAPVGSFVAGATPEGLLDLAGNVAEWVETNEPATPLPSMPANEGLVCGGGYRTGSIAVSGASCRRIDAKAQSADIGFRCAYDHPPDGA